MLAIPVGKPRLFLADKGYDGDFLREELLIHGIRPVIPPKANRKNPPACDFRVYKDRNRIERMFNRLKQFRRVATRYDKTRKSFSAFLALAAAKIWLPYFVNRTQCYNNDHGQSVLMPRSMVIAGMVTVAGPIWSFLCGS